MQLGVREVIFVSACSLALHDLNDYLLQHIDAFVVDQEIVDLDEGLLQCFLVILFLVVIIFKKERSELPLAKLGYVLAAMPVEDREQSISVAEVHVADVGVFLVFAVALHAADTISQSLVLALFIVLFSGRLGFIVEIVGLPHFRHPSDL